MTLYDFWEAHPIQIWAMYFLTGTYVLLFVGIVLASRKDDG